MRLNRELTKREYNELAAIYYAENNEQWESIFDKDGNPTLSTLMAFYESEHNIGQTVTLEDMQEWLASL